MRPFSSSPLNRGGIRLHSSSRPSWLGLLLSPLSQNSRDQANSSSMADRRPMSLSEFRARTRRRIDLGALRSSSASSSASPAPAIPAPAPPAPIAPAPAPPAPVALVPASPAPVAPSAGDVAALQAALAAAEQETAMVQAQLADADARVVGKYLTFHTVHLLPWFAASDLLLHL